MLATAGGAAALQQSGLMHLQHTRPGRPARRKSSWLGCGGFFAATTAVFFLVALCARGILLSEMPLEGLYQSHHEGEEQQQEPRLYGLSPLPVFGAAIQGVNLSSPVAPDVVEQLKRDVLRHRLLLFRDQNVTVDRHKEIAAWWQAGGRGGPVKYLNVSNVKALGAQGAGADGWHVDGAFKDSGPDHVALYYSERTSKGAATAFAPLRELLNSLTPSQRMRWDRLWIYDAAFELPVLRPFLYAHPHTQEPTLNVYFDVDYGWVWDAGLPSQRNVEPLSAELDSLDREVLDVFHRALRSGMIYSHVWRDGDLIISDNPSLAHLALPDTQLPAEEVGERLLRRATVEGRILPSKGCRPNERRG